MEIKFIAPDIEMKTKFDKFLSSKNSQDELSAFGTYFIWSECYGTKIHMDENFALIKTDKNDLNYCFPVGKLSDEELKKALNYMIYDCKKSGGKRLKISRLKKEDAESFENYEKLGFEGGAILVDGKIVACTIGEKINSDNFVVHFEKAFTEFEGAYTIINQEFSKTLEDRFKFINREEDLGIEGLRKAKLSYRPFLLLEKYDAFEKIS